MNSEAPRIDQALIAIGGNANRLKAAGIDAPYGKSYLEYRGISLLAYSLDTWTREGLSRFVFAGDTIEKLRKAEKLVAKLSDSLPIKDAVFGDKPDEGLGTTGLPFHYRDVLDKQFVFDFGQNAARNVICDLLIKAKTPEVVVFRGFYPKEDSDHPAVYVDPVTNVAFPPNTEHIQDPPLQLAEVAAPFVLDRQWIDEIPRHNYNFAEMVNARARIGGLKVVYESQYVDVPEIDTPDDYDRMLGESSDPFTRFVQEHEIYLSSLIDPEALQPYANIPERASKFQVTKYLDNYKLALLSAKALELMGNK